MYVTYITTHVYDVKVEVRLEECGKGKGSKGEMRKWGGHTGGT